MDLSYAPVAAHPAYQNCGENCAFSFSLCSAPRRPRSKMANKQATETISRAAVVVIASYIAAQMLADVASVKIGTLSLPALGSLAVDMGTFIYPITFTLRDVVHKLLGRSVARTLVVAAGAINLGMAAYLVWAASFPSDASWGLGAEFAAVLTPVWRITLASIAAEVVSELLDTELYHLFVTRITRRYQWARVLVSNSLSVPVDNVIFAVDRKSTHLNSSHVKISYAVFCLKKKTERLDAIL